jgi:hypothetical protein
MWTDTPEMTQYVEVFNNEHPSLKLEVKYTDNLDKALRINKDEKPAIIVGKWLKGSRIRYQFQSLDRLSTELRLNSSAFYPEMLSLGKADGRQVLLPVSFNLPAVVFLAENSKQVKSGFSITINEIRDQAKAYNQRGATGFSQIGFSPRWDFEFIYALSRLNGADFREGKPIAWNQAGLESTVSTVRDWVTSANESSSIEDDYQFKYLQAPSYEIVSSRRALFFYASSSEIFTLPDEKRSVIDYRWISDGKRIPVCDDVTFLGLSRKAGGGRVAESFVSWFFSEQTQRKLLAQSNDFRTDELSFGIAGGFSSLRDVNEKVLPSYYSNLVGHVPQPQSLFIPATQGQSWTIIKQEFVKPYLQELCASPAGSPVPKQSEMQKKLNTWLKENPLP